MRGAHSHAQLDVFGLRSVRFRFHRQMQQHLVTAALRFFGDFGRERQMRQHGNRQRKTEREHSVGSGAVVAEIVNDDSEARIRLSLLVLR